MGKVFSGHWITVGEHSPWAAALFQRINARFSVSFAVTRSTSSGDTTKWYTMNSQSHWLNVQCTYTCHMLNRSPSSSTGEDTKGGVQLKWSWAMNGGQREVTPLLWKVQKHSYVVWEYFTSGKVDLLFHISHLTWIARGQAVIAERSEVERGLVIVT